MPPQLAPSHTAPPCGQTTSILERTANAPCPPGEAAAKTPPWRCKPPPSAASSNSSVETSAASPPYCSACTPIASAESSGHIDRRTISLSHGAGNGLCRLLQTTRSQPQKTTGQKCSVTSGQYRNSHLSFGGLLAAALQ